MYTIKTSLVNLTIFITKFIHAFIKMLHVSTFEDPQHAGNMQHCRKASTAFIIKDS